MEQTLPTSPLVLTTAKIVGAATPTVWSQVAVLHIPVGDEEEKQIALLITVMISRTDNEDAAFLGREVVTSIQAVFKEGLANVTKASLLEKVHQALHEAQNNLEVANQALVDKAVAIAVISENTLASGVVGSANTILVRGQKLYPLFTATGAVQTLSGTLLAKDYLILGTNSFFESSYPTTEVFDGNNSADVIGDIITPVLLSLPDNADIAALLVFCKPAEIIQAEIPAPAPVTAVIKPTSLPVTANESIANSSVSSRSITEPANLHPLEMAKPSATTYRKQPINLPAEKIQSGGRPTLYALKTVTVKHAAVLHKALNPFQIRVMVANNRKRAFRLIFIGIIIIIVLAGAVGFTTVRRHQRKSEVIALYTLAKQNVAIANSIKTQDPKRALQVTKEAQDAVNRAKQLDKTIIPPGGLEQDIADVTKAILVVTAIENPETFFDTTLIKEGFNGTKIDFAENTLLITDANAPTLLRIILPEKTAAIASGGNKLPQFVSSAQSGKRLLVLTQDGLFSIDPDSGNPHELQKKDPVWGTPVDLASFAGNVYVLDSAKGQIWKYSQTETGFGSAKNIIGSESESLVQGVESLMIDGTFWMTHKNTILHVINSKVQQVVINNLDKPLGNYIRLASTAESQVIYILDRENKRIIVMNKEGNYVSQYASTSFGNVSSLALNQETKELYLLSGSKILKIPLTQP